MQRKLAYVEDDDVIRRNYSEMLRDEGFDVTAYSNKEDAIDAFRRGLPDLALLDVSLHGERDAGYQVCTELRTLSNELPIIFLTSHDGEIDKVSGLRLGADDYITKDASIDYIIIRIEALFRRIDAVRGTTRTPGTVPAASTQSSLEIDEVYSSASWKGTKVELPLTHFWILSALHSAPGQVKSHRELMQASNIVVEPNTITAHVKAIRDAFTAVDPEFQSIKTERGRGYRWVEA
ncbi:MAG: proteobacterial dedicated sortase system response regulator [Halioglobus sp.]